MGPLANTKRISCSIWSRDEAKRRIRKKHQPNKIERKAGPSNRR